jgi:hypothetical protein
MMLACWNERKAFFMLGGVLGGVGARVCIFRKTLRHKISRAPRTSAFTSADDYGDDYGGRYPDSLTRFPFSACPP